MQAEVPTSLVGAMAIAVAALASVVVYLFRLYHRRNLKTETKLAAKDAAIAAERMQWAIERAKMNADHEAQLEALHAENEQRLSQQREQMKEREIELRKECTDLMDRVAMEAQKAAAMHVDVLQKMYDRFIGGPPRRGRSQGG